VLMIAVAASSLFIRTIRTWGVWSPPSICCRCSRCRLFRSPSFYARRFALAGANHHAIVFGA
jgi:uncharacterized membrane protein